MSSIATNERGVWSEEEHNKFLAGLKMYPKGPWTLIAAHVGTRSPRQVRTHAQKYFEKVARRLRGLQKERKRAVRPEHRLGEDMVALCKVAESDDASEVYIVSEHRGVKPAVASATASTATDEFSDYAQVEEENGDHDHVESKSLVSLLAEGKEACDVALDGVSNSDEMDAIIDFDASYLDFLIETLESSECASDGSCSE